MNIEYVQRLLELTKELKEETDDFFEVSGSRDVSQSRSNLEVVYISKVNYLLGYISALKETHSTSHV